MNSRITLSAETLNIEIVIIGGNGAGLAAAIAAREKGSAVVVNERVYSGSLK